MWFVLCYNIGDEVKTHFSFFMLLFFFLNEVNLKLLWTVNWKKMFKRVNKHTLKEKKKFFCLMSVYHSMFIMNIFSFFQALMKWFCLIIFNAITTKQLRATTCNVYAYQFWFLTLSGLKKRIQFFKKSTVNNQP